MRTLGFRQRLEPVSDLVEVLVAGRLGHTGIHIRIFVRLSGNRCLEVVARRTDGFSGRRVAGFLEELKMAVSVTGFAFCRRAEDRSNVVVAFYIGFLSKIEIDFLKNQLPIKTRVFLQNFQGSQVSH